MRKSLAASMQGFTIIEVVFAVLFLMIVIVGLSQLFVSGMEQENFDTRDQLAQFGVNNMWERTLTMARDNYGPSSEGGQSYLGCGPKDPGEYKYTKNGNENNYPPAAPDLFIKCPNCIYDVSYICTKPATHTWDGGVNIRNGSGGELIATLPFPIYQPGE